MPAAVDAWLAIAARLQLKLAESVVPMSEDGSSPGLQFHWSEDGTLVTLVGDLKSQRPGADTDRALQGLNVDAAKGRGCVTADLRQASEFDSSGIGLLVCIRQRLCERELSLRMYGAGSRLRGVVELLGIADELGVQRGPDRLCGQSNEVSSQSHQGE